MRYLVTGGAGFIGSNLADQLLADGNQVVILDNFDPTYPRSVKEMNIAKASSYRNFKLVEGDIRDRELLCRTIVDNKIELIVHLAAKTGVRHSLEMADEYYDVNVRGTLCILETMKELGLGKLVFASSSSVYGNSNEIPFREDCTIDFPISPYASSKRSGELLCHVYSHLYGFDISCLRLFTVFGPRQRPDLAIYKFTTYINDDRYIPFYGDGSTSRDYTYVSDTVMGIIAAAERVRRFDIFNLGGASSITLDHLVKKIGFYLKKEPKLDRRPMQPGDVITTCGSVLKASKVLNYRPKITIDEGLKLFINWYFKIQMQHV